MHLTDEEAFEAYHQADKEMILNPTEFSIALRYYLAGCAHRKENDLEIIRGCGILPGIKGVGKQQKAMAKMIERFIERSE